MKKIIFLSLLSATLIGCSSEPASWKQFNGIEAEPINSNINKIEKAINQKNVWKKSDKSKGEK